MAAETETGIVIEMVVVMEIVIGMAVVIVTGIVIGMVAETTTGGETMTVGVTGSAIVIANIIATDRGTLILDNIHLMAADMAVVIMAAVTILIR